MRAEIIAIGSELLLGETIDTNSAFLAQQLTHLGIDLFRKSVIGDNQARIAATLLEALDRADLVICTGGLGPTVDDMTREAIAQALERPLEFHQHLLDQIADRFRSFGREMSPSNRQQAFVPQGARIVENPRGTAPSFIVEDARSTVVVLPGVPSEMRFLWETAILPYLRDERGQTSVLLVKNLYAAGTSESAIGEMLADLMEQHNPTLGISAKRGRFELRIGAKATTQADAEVLLAQAEATIQERVGQYLIGNEDLTATVLELLRSRGLQLALYEGTTRAPVYQAFVAGGGQDRLRGVMLHPLDQATDGAAAESLARGGADNAASRWNAPLALGVQAAFAPDADGFTTVAVVLVLPKGEHTTWSRRFDLRLDDNWNAVATMALDGLRLALTAAEQ